VTVEAIVIAGQAESMGALGDERANLVITSPPFFDAETEALLRQRRSEQKDFDSVERRVLSFADSMYGAFREIARVLSRTGTFILHTKDLRFGNALVPLAARHESVAHKCGFRTVTRIYWLPVDRPPRSGGGFKRLPTVGAFRAREVETFNVFRFAKAPSSRGASVEGVNDVSGLTEPLWMTPGEQHQPRHQHASPPDVLKRLILLFSEPGDLVLDPFCGGGGALELALGMGRSAIGFESNPQHVEMARERLRRFQ